MRILLGINEPRQPILKFPVLLIVDNWDSFQKMWCLYLSSIPHFDIINIYFLNNVSHEQFLKWRAKIGNQYIDIELNDLYRACYIPTEAIGPVNCIAFSDYRSFNPELYLKIMNPELVTQTLLFLFDDKSMQDTTLDCENWDILAECMVRNLAKVLRIVSGQPFIKTEALHVVSSYFTEQYDEWLQHHSKKSYSSIRCNESLNSLTCWYETINPLIQKVNTRLMVKTARFN